MVAVRRRVAFAFARKNSLSKVYSHIFQIGTLSGLRPAMFTHTNLVVWTSPFFLRRMSGRFSEDRLVNRVKPPFTENDLACPSTLQSRASPPKPGNIAEIFKGNGTALRSTAIHEFEK